MAKPPDTEPAITFFRPTDGKTIARILERARKADERDSRKQSRPGRATRVSGLALALGKALAHHGRARPSPASIRPTAPSTGGRAFHFAHSTVTRGTSRRSASAPASGSGATNNPGTGAATGAGTSTTSGTQSGRSGGASGAATTREGAHQSYIERDAAIAPDIEAERDHAYATERGSALTVQLDADIARAAGRAPDLGPAPGIDREAGIRRVPTEQDLAWVRERIAGREGYGAENSPAAAQIYIENPEKLATTTLSSSFGTIGETAAERLEFWEMVHAHESEHGGRTQSRLVLELPHEASPAARREIVRRYTDTLTAAGIPFWASIHAPTAANDSRNHHAHIVYTDRPASRMIDPATGKLAWDFTIAEEYRNTTRHTRTRYPFRQKRAPEMRAIDYVKKARSRFAAITNEVMKEYGCPVRYDARSYKDMGLDIEPMKNVSRIVADKMKKHDFVVMDAAWTRKMIQQETEAAAQNRDATLRKLKAVEGRIAAVAETVRSINAANRALPPKMRMSPASRLTRRIAVVLTTRILTAERERLRDRFANEAARRTLVHIVEATAPHKLRGSPTARVYKSNPDAPDPEVLRSIHESATEELALFDKWAGARRTGRNRRVRASLDDWATQARPAATAPAEPAYEPMRPAASVPSPGAARHSPPPQTTPRPGSTAQSVPPAYQHSRSGPRTPQPSQFDQPSAPTIEPRRPAPRNPASTNAQTAAGRPAPASTMLDAISARMAATAMAAMATAAQGSDPTDAMRDAILAEIDRRAQARAAAAVATNLPATNLTAAPRTPLPPRPTAWVAPSRDLRAEQVARPATTREPPAPALAA